MTLYLATADEILSGDWIGLGLSSPSALFTRSSVILPTSATIVGIALSIRANALAAGQSVTAAVYTSPCGFTAPVSVGVSVTVTGPNPPNCRNAAIVLAPVSAEDLLSVQITTDSGVPLSGGAAVTLFFTIP